VAFGQRQKHGTEKAIRAIRNDSGRRETVSRTIGVKLAWNACQGRLPLRREGLAGNKSPTNSWYSRRVRRESARIPSATNTYMDAGWPCRRERSVAVVRLQLKDCLVASVSMEGAKTATWAVNGTYGEILEGTGRWEHRTIGEELLSVLAMRLKA